MTNHSRKILLPIAALFQIAGSSLPQIFGWGVNIGDRSRALDTAIIPAGWAFSIWGVIFLWSIVFALYSASRPQERSALVDKVTWPAIGVFTMNGLWGLYTPFVGLDLGSEVIIVVGLVCAIFAALTAGRYKPVSSMDRLLIASPLGLVAGWLTAASFVGASSIAWGLGIELANIKLLAILAGATAFASTVIFLKAPLTYAVAICWALIAIASKNYAGGEQVFVFAAGAAILLIVAVTLISAKQRDS